MRRWVLQTIPVFLLSFIFTSFPPSLYLWNSHLASDILFSPPRISSLCFVILLLSKIAMRFRIWVLLSSTNIYYLLFSCCSANVSIREQDMTKYPKPIKARLLILKPANRAHKSTLFQVHCEKFVWNMVDLNTVLYTHFGGICSQCELKPWVTVINVIQNKGQFKNKK